MGIKRQDTLHKTIEYGFIYNKKMWYQYTKTSKGTNNDIIVLDSPSPTQLKL